MYIYHVADWAASGPVSVDGVRSDRLVQSKSSFFTCRIEQIESDSKSHFHGSVTENGITEKYRVSPSTGHLWYDRIVRYAPQAVSGNVSCTPLLA